MFAIFQFGETVCDMLADGRSNFHLLLVMFIVINFTSCLPVLVNSDTVPDVKMCDGNLIILSLFVTNLFCEKSQEEVFFYLRNISSEPYLMRSIVTKSLQFHNKRIKKRQLKAAVLCFRFLLCILLFAAMIFATFSACAFICICGMHFPSAAAHHA